MNINVAVDTRAFEAINRKRYKRIAFGVVNAINSTAELIQKAEHEHVRKEFIVRKPDFFFGTPGSPGGVAAKLTRASVGKARPYAEIFVGGTSKGGPLLLPVFEEGGTRKPFTPGAKKVAVPRLGGPARPSIARGIPPAFTFAGLKLRKFKRGKLQRRRRRGRTVDETVFQEFGRLNRSVIGQAAEAGVQWKGEQRTYMIPEVGVFQRIGPEQKDRRLVWGFLPPFPIDARLDFVATAQTIADRWFHKFMELETTEALVRVR